MLLRSRREDAGSRGRSGPSGLPFLGLALAAATAGFLSQVVQSAEPEALLDRRLTEQTSLIGQLMTAARHAKRIEGLSQPTREEMERLEQEGYALLRAGKRGEASRVFYRVMALGLGRKWTPRRDYRRSLVLRTDMTVHEPDRELVLELGQIYASEYVPSVLFELRATLHRGGGEGEAPGTEVAVAEGVWHDLVHRPYRFAVDLGDVGEGSYMLEVEVSEDGRLLRRLTAPLRLVRDLASTREEVERRLASVSGHDSAKTSVRYPFDFALQVNLGRVEPRDYDFRRGIEESLSLLSQVEQGQDPLYQAVGDLKRHYYFEEAGEIMPYRLIVPETYTGNEPFPLVVALHGRGGNEDTMAFRESGLMRELAREHGYIVASPMGYRPDGGYGGVTEDVFFANPYRIRKSRLSERDVMNVLDLVRAEYRIDEDRIYLMGHSGGGGGTWRMAAKYPSVWAGLAPIATQATLDDESLQRIRHIPVFVSHGDADALTSVESARSMASKMEALGMRYEYREIPGGTHDLVDESLPRVFAFFDRLERD